MICALCQGGSVVNDRRIQVPLKPLHGAEAQEQEHQL